MPFNKIAELGMELGKGQVFINQLQAQIQQLQTEIEQLNKRLTEGTAENRRLIASQQAAGKKQVN